MPAIKERYEASREPLKSKYEANLDGMEDTPKKTILEEIRGPKRYQTRSQRAEKGGFVENKENEDRKELSNIMYCVRTVKGFDDDDGSATILVGAEDNMINKYKFGYGDVK